MTAKNRHHAVLQYCMDTGKDWDAISKNPALFNQAWREMLRLPKDTTPPPLQYRSR